MNLAPSKIFASFGARMITWHAWTKWWHNKPQYEVIDKKGAKVYIRENWNWNCCGDGPCTKVKTGTVECAEIVKIS
jgi:hypothetical protein